MAEQPPKKQNPEKPKLQKEFQEPESPQPQRLDISQVPAGQMTMFVWPPIIISPDTYSKLPGESNQTPADTYTQIGMQVPLPPVEGFSPREFISNETNPFFKGAETGAVKGDKKEEIIQSILRHCEELREKLKKAISVREQELNGRVQGYNAALSGLNLELPLDKFSYDPELDEQVTSIHSQIEGLKQDYKVAIEGLNPIPTKKEQAVLEKQRTKDSKKSPIEQALGGVGKTMEVINRFSPPLKAILGATTAVLLTYSSGNYLMRNTPTGETISAGTKQVALEAIHLKDQLLDPYTSVVRRIDPRLKTEISTTDNNIRKLQVFYKTPGQAIGDKTQSRIEEAVSVENLGEMSSPRTIANNVQYDPETGILTITLEPIK